MAYWVKPREKIINGKNFDFYPKGTTCLISTKSNLSKAYQEINSYSDDGKSANDDTLLLRIIARENGIVISPLYQSLYTPRSSLKDFASHTFHRGKVFADGHIFNLSTWGVSLICGTLFLTSLFLFTSTGLLIDSFLICLGLVLIAIFPARFSPKHVLSFIFITPIFVACYLSGIAWGSAQIVKNLIMKRKGK
jgi:hypothetical protein